MEVLKNIYLSSKKINTLKPFCIFLLFHHKSEVKDHCPMMHLIHDYANCIDQKLHKMFTPSFQTFYMIQEEEVDLISFIFGLEFSIFRDYYQLDPIDKFCLCPYQFDLISKFEEQFCLPKHLF